jgi:CubicO group peptidase (beta-lactamase class C family)
LHTARPEDVGLSSDRLARLDRLARRYIDSGRVQGIVALIARNGRIAHLGAYGWADRESSRRMTTDALFRIASQSKALTSVAAMILVEEGRLALGEPVARYVPSLARPMVAERTDTGRALVPARRPITIRHLLTHSAGISYGTDSLLAATYRGAGLGPAAGYGWYFADKAEPICESIDRLGSLPLAAQPGERWVYGYSTDILGCVVERASGQSLDAFLRTRILEPLRMRDTYFFVPTAKRERLTTVYAADTTGRLARAADGAWGQGHYADGPRVSFSGGAGLVSTAGDYARFLQMLLDGGELDGVRILSPKSVELMTVDHSGALYRQPGMGFGLGFEILEDPGEAGRYGSPGAWGWGGAYHSSYRVDPRERMVMVVLTQTLPARSDLLDRFMTLAYQAVVEPAALAKP